MTASSKGPGNEQKVGEAHLPFSDLYHGIEEWLPLERDSKYAGLGLSSPATAFVSKCGTWFGKESIAI